MAGTATVAQTLETGRSGRLQNMTAFAAAALALALPQARIDAS